MLKIASWNVNSIRVRLPQLLDWLSSSEVDIVGLQETKVVDADFPSAAIEELGYHVVYSGQKTYNGVALLSREPITAVETDIPDLDDPQRRILAATVGALRIVDLYVPNGSAVDSEKYAYKLDWLAKVNAYLAAQLQMNENVVVMGDFNIAPEDRDVHDPIAWQGHVLVSDKERQAFQAMLELGLNDTFRLFPQEDGRFSWWDYRNGALWRNAGLRIDHILASDAMATHCKESTIDKAPRKLKRPSDHAPVVAAFEV